MARAIFKQPCLLLVLLFTACAPLIAGYSLEAYKNATALKADVAALVDESTDDYSKHQTEISVLTLKMNEAYEFSKGEPDNALSTEQWEILIDPNGHLYGGFIKQWQKQGHLSATATHDKKIILDRAFNYIICLEANKQAATACPKPEAMPQN